MPSAVTRTSWRRVRPIVVLGAWLLAGLVAYAGWIWLTGSPGCERLATYPPVPSPTGEFLVGVKDEVCSDGGFVTVLPTTVEIWRGGTEGERFALLVVEYGGYRPAGPHLAWTGSHELSIQLESPYGTWLERPPFAGLTLKVTVAPPAVDRVAR